MENLVWSLNELRRVSPNDKCFGQRVHLLDDISGRKFISGIDAMKDEADNENGREEDPAPAVELVPRPGQRLVEVFHFATCTVDDIKQFWRKSRCPKIKKLNKVCFDV